jgi:hypothetical protein
MKKISKKYRPNIVLVVARGEAVRNFLYSDTLPILCQHARVTLLTVLHDEKFIERFGSIVDQIIPLKDFEEHRIVRILREIIAMAHYRWIWTEKVKNKWDLLDHQAKTTRQKLRNKIYKFLAYLFANRLSLNLLAFLEYHLSLWLKPTDEFKTLFATDKPDLVFNCSHIHAPLGEMPIRVAHKMGIRTATFIFSWDNLSSRGRILPPYDDYLVWHQGMRDELLQRYKFIKPEQVHITGTPQFDYHFKPKYHLTYEELAEKIGLDPARPFILYTTGMDRDFPEEVNHVKTVIDILHKIEGDKRPQLVVRTYVKGNSPEMEALAEAMKANPDVIFPPVLWEPTWFMPKYEDLAIYTSLLKHCLFGINPASTVSLELMMFGKPVINIGFDPPSSDLPDCLRWKRHIDFDHYQPVAHSGAVRVAYSVDAMRTNIDDYLRQGNLIMDQQVKFLRTTFDDTLDGSSGKRVADVLLKISKEVKVI